MSSWDRVINNSDHRWAYVIAMSPITDSIRSDGLNGEQTRQFMTDFIRQIVPVFQKSEMAGSIRPWQLVVRGLPSSQGTSLNPFLKKTILVICAFVAMDFAVATEAESPRQNIRLDDNWRFFSATQPNASSPGFDRDSGWRSVTLPHDWSIEGRIDPKASTGGGGGFFPSGIGWYRQTISAPADWTGRQVNVEFEGVYMNATVWLNGQQLAFIHYGYTSFNIDLDSRRCQKPGAIDNILTVRVDNSQQKNSRWYSGSGIYRHVWLTVSDPVHVAPWGVFVSMPRADSQTATVVVQTDILNQTSTAKSAEIETTLFAPDGKDMGRTKSTMELPASGNQKISQELALKNPPLWSPETPQISRVVTNVVVDGRVVDEANNPVYGVLRPGTVRRQGTHPQRQDLQTYRWLHPSR